MRTGTIEHFERPVAVLAGALLLAGLAYAFLAVYRPGDRVPEDVPAAPGTFEPTVVEVPECPVAHWPQPLEQAPGWLFDVFTPPKVFIDPDTGAFVPTAWKPSEDACPGFYLEDIRRMPFRVQMEGYVEEDPSDPARTLLLLYDLESAASLRLRAGEASRRAGVKVLGFTVRRARGPDGGIAVTPEVRVRDIRRGGDYRLRMNETCYGDGVEAVLRSRGDPSFRVAVHREGDQFKSALGTYVVADICLDAAEVTLIRLGDDRRQSEMRAVQPACRGTGPVLEADMPAVFASGDESGSLFDFRASYPRLNEP